MTKYKKPLCKLLIVIGTLALFTFSIFFISCTSDFGVTEKIDVTAIEEEELEDIAVELELLEVEKIDYEDAAIGAEIKGVIPQYLCTDKENYIKIEIKNTSDFTWRSTGPNIVRVGYHYYGQDVPYTEYDNTTRTSLPSDVEPGETVTVEVLIDDIEHRGIYILQIDLALEGHFWFSSKDVAMLVGPVYFGPCSE